jgi:hypothetical protein
MAMYIPYIVETPSQSFSPQFSPSPAPDYVSQVSELQDATAATAHRFAPCIRKRPISLLEVSPHDLCTTPNSNILTSVKDASHTGNILGFHSQALSVMPPAKKRRRSSSKIP